MWHRLNVHTVIQKAKTNQSGIIKMLVLTAAGLGLGAAIPLATAGASAGPPASGWHVGYYTPSSQTLSFQQASSVAGSVASTNFTSQPNTALLVTNQKAQNPSLLGDLTGKSVSATATVSGVNSGASFTFGGPDYCGTNTSFVRYYFETSNAGGFDFTHYWWSNPVHANLTGNGPVVLGTVSFDGANWSDWNGQQGNTQTAGFNAAVSNVTQIGLSFGGDCFFENGVGTTDGSGTFTLNSYTVN